MTTDPRTATTTPSQIQPPPDDPHPGAQGCTACKCQPGPSASATAYERGHSPPGLATRMLWATVIVMAVAAISMLLATDRLDVVSGIVTITAAMATSVWLGVELALWRVTRALSILDDMRDRLDRHCMEVEIKLHTTRSLLMDIRQDQLMMKGDNR